MEIKRVSEYSRIWICFRAESEFVLTGKEHVTAFYPKPLTLIYAISSNTRPITTMRPASLLLEKERCLPS